MGGSVGPWILGHAMMHTRLLARTALLAAAMLLGCPAPVIPPPPTPPAPTADCADVCDHWRALGCSPAEPSPDGQPCEVLCDVMGDTWDLGCVATVEACDDIDEC